MSLRTALAPLRRSGLRRLLVTQLVADIGDGVVTVALPLYVYERTGSATVTSIAFVAEMLVGLVLAVIGGGLADSRNRRTVLLLSYAARAVIVVVTAAVTPLLAVMGFGVLARSIGMIDNPSFDAIIPNLAEGDLQQVIGARRQTHDRGAASRRGGERLRFRSPNRDGAVHQQRGGERRRRVAQGSRVLADHDLHDGFEILGRARQRLVGQRASIPAEDGEIGVGAAQIFEALADRTARAQLVAKRVEIRPAIAPGRAGSVVVPARARGCRTTRLSGVVLG